MSTNADFSVDLYDEDDEQMDQEDDEIESVIDRPEEASSDDDEVDPDCGSLSPAATPYSRECRRDRSRSPISLAPEPLAQVYIKVPPSNIGSGIHDEADMPVDDAVDINRMPDGRRVRGSGRGRSGQGRGGGRCQLGSPTWQIGHPLEEIWVTDDDVPCEWRERVKDAERRRKDRVHVSAAGRSTRESNVDEGADSATEEDSTLVGEDFHFKWYSMETFQGKEEEFIPKRTGSVLKYTNAYDAFRSYWDDSILQIIVDETNRYASQIRSAPFHTDWYPTNSHEVLCLFAFWMMSGIIRMPTVRSYFSNNVLLKTDIFSRITTLNRYNNLNKALHFVETNHASGYAYSTNNSAANYNQTHRLRPIIDHLNSKFQSNYILSKDICIDESLTLWKGRLNFKQCIRTKAAKFGIKTFELCESATGYLWSFLVYTGKQSSNDHEGNVWKSAAVVRKLIKPLLNKGHRLFMDSWYNSPLLARFLKRNGTDCVGPLRPTQQNVPKLVTLAPLNPGQLIARHSGDICVLSWQDKNQVNMISTCHGSAVGLPTVPTRPPPHPLPYKPQVVLDYDRSTSGVHLKDHMLEPYLLERKRCARWYIKFFKSLLNCSIHNSRIMLESSTKVRQDNLQFRLELVHAILAQHHALIPLTPRAAAARSDVVLYPQIVEHPHWPGRIAQSPYEAAHNRKGRQKCIVCLKNKKTTRTHFQCEECNVPLCADKCFKIYHTTPQ